MKESVLNIRFLTGNADMLERASETPVWPTWDERTIEFLGAFSRNLLRDARSKRFEDIVSYAFWIRNASLRQIQAYYYPHVEDKVGRGVAFHVAPSNVPINFAVSFTSSLLAGNINVVRLSNKAFEQADIIIDCLRKTFLEGYAEMESRLILVRYDHDEAITQYLTSICDVRIIWGGNQTIQTVRSAPLPPRAIELAFADRHSIALLDSDRVMTADMNQLAADFYTDTYYIDQNACSSPRIVVWFGNHVQEAKVRFWDAVEALVREKYDFQDIQAIDKLDILCQLAATGIGVRRSGDSNQVMRVEVEHIEAGLMDYKYGGGYFFEYAAQELSELIPILNKPCQTLSYYGLDGSALQRYVIDKGVRGCDRIVPIGKTMDLTFKWDGFDMIETMSRYVYCPNYRI